MILPIAYFSLTILMLAFILFTSNYTIKEGEISYRYFWITVAGLGVWHMYVYGMSGTELLADFSLPPRVAVYFILPLFLFTGVFLFAHKHKKWIGIIPAVWIVGAQFFRVVVEILLAWAAEDGVLPHEVTILGYNYDMIFAATAPLVVYMVFIRKAWSQRIVLWWNYLGLTVLATVIFVFMSTIYWPEIHGSNSPLMSTSFTQYPYTLVAGFLMPLAVFMHVLSIVQIKHTLSS